MRKVDNLGIGIRIVSWWLLNEQRRGAPILSRNRIETVLKSLQELILKAADCFGRRSTLASDV